MSALKENEKYLDSIQGKLDQFNNAVQTMWSNTLDSGVIKAIVDLGTGLVKIVDKLGLVNTLVFGVMTYLSVIKKDKLDFASLLGIHDMDKGWTFGKEGLTGWVKKKFGKDKSITEEIIGDPEDIKVDAKEYAEAITDNINDYVTVDTSNIDTQIEDVQNKLMVAREQLNEIPKGKGGWDYYKSHRDNRIAEKQKEISSLEQQLTDLQTKRSETMSNAALKYANNSIEGIATQEEKALSKYLDIFENGLPQGTEKLTYDTQQLGMELDKLSNMDNSGIINYMSSLDNLGDVGDDTKRVLAGYASTVKDGNYTVQGAQQYVNQYNQQLEQTSKSATKARLAQAGLNLAISLVTMALTALITKLIELAANAQKKFDKLSSQLSETESELKDINSQLDETKERIQELQEQGVLTFTDREELDRLRALNDELERQKQLTEQIKAQQQKGVNEAAIDAAEQYKRSGKNSGKTDGEKIWGSMGTGAAIGGSAAGIALGAAGGAAGLGTAVFGSTVGAAATAAGTAGAANAWNPVGWGLLAAAAILAIGAGVGAIVGAIRTGEEDVGTAMENMRDEHEKLQKKYEKKSQKFAEKGGSGRRKRMEEASEELAEYESMMAEHFAEMDQYYSSIDLSVYDEVKDADTIERLRAEMNEFYDTRDKWLIQSGGANAKSNAISRIFGDNASQKLKDIKKEIQDTLKTGEEFDFGSAFDEDFKQRLYAMGLTVADVKYYFQELKKAEDEAVEFTTDDAIKSVANLADKVDSLKGAFDEFNETGIVTAKTLVSLSETFGSMGDKWENFVNIMSSGTATTAEAKEAINELVEMLITSALSGEEIGAEQYVTLLAQLTNLGVKNASEILNGIRDYSSIGEQIANDVVNNEKTIEQAIADYEKANNVLLTAEQKQVVIATYNAKDAKSKADIYRTQANTLSTLASEYTRVTVAEKEWENEVEDAANTKSGRFLGFLWKVQNQTDKERETNTILNEEAVQKNREAVEKQIESLYSQVFGDAGTATDTDARILELQTFFAEPKNYDQLSEEAQAALDKLADKFGLKVDYNFEDPSERVDGIQSIYDTLASAQNEYIENNRLSIDTMQSLLELDPKYIALLYDEQGQLNLNDEAIRRVTKARIEELGVKKQSEILSKALALAQKGEIDALNEWIRVNDEVVQSGGDWIEQQKDSIRQALQNNGFDSTYIEGFMSVVTKQVNAVSNATTSAKTSVDDLGNTLSAVSNRIDSIQGAYSSLTDVVKEYNKNGFVNLDNLQALLSLEPEYLAVLQMENGQLSINQTALTNMLQAQLLKTRATIIDNAIIQLNTLSQQAQQTATEGVTNAMNNATPTLAGYASQISNVGQEAVIAAGKLSVLMEAAGGAEAAGVDPEKIKAVMEGMDAALKVTADTYSALPMNFGAIVAPNPGSEDDPFQKAMDYWENRIQANQAKYEQIQNEIDLLEKKGKRANADYYNEQIKLENQRLSLLEQQKAEAQSFLNTFDQGSDEWWEVAHTLNDIESELDDVTASIVDLQDAIGEIDTYKFEEFNNRLDDITSKLSTIRDLIAPNGEEDWFTDQGEWTEEGVAVLGTYIQELETYKNGIAETAKTLEKYQSAYAGNESYYENLGIHSEQEYYDKVEELTSQQYDYAQSVSDTEQSIVDMYESSVDAIEEYMDTLIEGYNDYIDSVKEALDVERDLYDFKKNVQKQAKDIAKLERRIASLSGSTNASDIAERRKLEAELYESRESLNETYYDHATNAQSEALDAERTAYEDTINRFVRGLRTSLDEATANMDEFLMGVTSMVMYNADTILAKYEETNLPLTTELTNPWIKAKEAVGDYSGNALDLMNQWTKEGGFFAQFNVIGTTNLESPWASGTTAAIAFQTSVSDVMEGVVSDIETNVQSASMKLSDLYRQIVSTENRAKKPEVVPELDSTPINKGLPPVAQKNYRTNAKLKVGTKTLSASGTGSTEAEAKKNAESNMFTAYYNYQRSQGFNDDAIYKLWTRQKSKIESNTAAAVAYAKGTTGTSRDEWAITDEFGPELKMYATPKGNLSFMALGSTVVPHDLTMDLIELPSVVDGLINRPNFDSGINMISNAINKPEIKLDIENFLNVGRVDQDTLPALEKMMDKKINEFSRQLNYALKGKGAR